MLWADAILAGETGDHAAPTHFRAALARYARLSPEPGPRGVLASLPQLGDCARGTLDCLLAREDSASAFDRTGPIAGESLSTASGLIHLPGSHRDSDSVQSPASDLTSKYCSTCPSAPEDSTSYPGLWCSIFLGHLPKQLLRPWTGVSGRVQRDGRS